VTNACSPLSISQRVIAVRFIFEGKREGLGKNERVGAEKLCEQPSDRDNTNTMLWFGLLFETVDAGQMPSLLELHPLRPRPD
jgi:hypothetical protein